MLLTLTSALETEQLKVWGPRRSAEGHKEEDQIRELRATAVRVLRDRTSAVCPGDAQRESHQALLARSTLRPPGKVWREVPAVCCPVRPVPCWSWVRGSQDPRAALPVPLHSAEESRKSRPWPEV